LKCIILGLDNFKIDFFVIDPGKKYFYQIQWLVFQ